MTSIALLNLRLSIKFWISYQVVQSWFKRWFFNDVKSWENFPQKML